VKTSLKRALGRSTQANGDQNGNAALPPAPLSSYRPYGPGPAPRRRSGLAIVGRMLVGALIVASALVLGVAGGTYLWLHQSVDAIRAHSVDVKTAQRRLSYPLPGHAAIALLVGYDQRQGPEFSTVSRSDTVMLVRADPHSKTISMLSFPRDLAVPIYCKNGLVSSSDRINSAYARCGATGTLETVKHLTGLPINYLIAVNFRGFRQIVNKLGGVWIDVDRRYYNKNVGTAATDYSDINLQPGYQRLSGESALQFVRFRHTDDDFHRLARQQQLIRSLKQQIAQGFHVSRLPSLVNVLTHNVEVGSKASFDLGTVKSYALLAATLPGGHFLQVRLGDVSGFYELSVPESSIQEAIREFVHPDVEQSKVANGTALGRKVKTAAPPPGETTVTVLDGSGVAGSAAAASSLLAERGYRTAPPPDGLAAAAPRQSFHNTVVYFDASLPRAKPAARALQRSLAPAAVRPLPRNPRLRALDPGSMLLVVLGRSFRNELAAPPAPTAPPHQDAYVREDPTAAAELLRPLAKRVPFTLQVPTVLERNSYPDTCCGDKAVRLYWIAPHKKAVRLVFKTGSNEYWGIEQTNYDDAPVLADKSFQHSLGGREFDLYYSGSHLHMAVLRAGGATYWVVNTLLDSLSNETMLAIARGLKPLDASR
jgi:LCP family protein required for cell wall assembly